LTVRALSTGRAHESATPFGTGRGGATARAYHDYHVIRFVALRGFVERGRNHLLRVTVDHALAALVRLRELM